MFVSKWFYDMTAFYFAFIICVFLQCSIMIGFICKESENIYFHPETTAMAVASFNIIMQ
jgi:hypothetical protein